MTAGDADALNAGEVGWETVCYSQEFGRPGTEVFGGSHGVPDSFLCFDVADEHEERVRYLYTHVRAPRAGRWVLHLGADSGQVEQVWLNGKALLPDSSGEPVPAAPEVALQEGLNLLVLACVQPPGQPLRAYAAPLELLTTPVRDRPAARLTWFVEPSELGFDIAPHKARRVGWYRCEAPAGMHTLRLDVDGESVQVWVNGAEAASPGWTDSTGCAGGGCLPGSAAGGTEARRLRGRGHSPANSLRMRRGCPFRWVIGASARWRITPAAPFTRRRFSLDSMSSCRVKSYSTWAR